MLYEYDGGLFDKNEDGKWICKIWAMKGPTGCMMDKEVPEPYQSRIEQAFIDSRHKFRAVEMVEEKEEIPETKEEKVEFIEKQVKIIKERKSKKTKTTFNPFQEK